MICILYVKASVVLIFPHGSDEDKQDMFWFRYLDGWQLPAHGSSNFNTMDVSRRKFAGNLGCGVGRSKAAATRGR